MRDGYVVTWRGREYEASPDADRVRVYAPEPGDGFEEVRPGRYVRVLEPGEYDGLAYVRTTCTWRGHPFLVLAETGNWHLVFLIASAMNGLAAVLALALLRPMRLAWIAKPGIA